MDEPIFSAQEQEALLAGIARGYAPDDPGEAEYSHLLTWAEKVRSANRLLDQVIAGEVDLYRGASGIVRFRLHKDESNEIQSEKTVC